MRGEEMTISKNKTRAVFTVPKTLKEEVEKIAKAENRSFSNLLVTILQEYVDKKNNPD
jgi:metal-responsive CopG/Arc/MetJ family transcriptional regulator